MQNVYVIIVAGGSGTRMGAALPKQFLELNGKPVLFHAINAFREALPDAKLIVVLPADQLSYLQMILSHFTQRIDIEVVAGGKNRYESVSNGLGVVPADAYVLVHDGVRPLVSEDLILRCLDVAREKGSAIPAIPVTDTICRLDEAGYSIVERSLLRAVQTPQAFHASILKKAFQQPYQESFTDEGSVVAADGGTVFLVEGEKSNIKITLPDDLIIAEALLRSRQT